MQPRWLALISTVLIATVASPQQRYSFSTMDAFSAASIPPCRGTHGDVYRYIDRNIAAHLGHLQRWVRQGSISAQNDGIAQMAEMLRSDLLSLGFQEAERDLGRRR